MNERSLGDQRSSRVDLHVHSKFSDRPSEWFLRRIGAPESFVEPADLYQTLRTRGMDFVTITDHNSIRGALEIADRPNTFLSVELTTYFPEDGCKIHCLAFGITPGQFEQLQSARENIYDLRDYLVRERIAHAIAHPLFRINDKLQPHHVEKLLLLFNTFEGLNGAREPRACRLARAIFAALTPSFIEALADAHGIAPVGPEPWIKHLTGGSDDHSGLYAGHAHTVTPPAANVAALLDHLRSGRHQPAGRPGSSLRLAHSLYHIAYSYYRTRFLQGQKVDGSLLGALLRRLSEPSTEPRRRPARSCVGTALRRPFQKALYHWRRRRCSDLERTLLEEFHALTQAFEAPQRASECADRQRFEVAAHLAQRLLCTFATHASRYLRDGRLLEALQSFSALGPTLLAIAPYLTAFGAQHKDDAFLRALERHFSLPTRAARHRRRAWLTDTFDDLNGVAHTIRMIAGLAARRGQPITVVTCRPETPTTPFPLRNFEPLALFTVREYEQQPLAIPPVLDLVAWLEEQHVEELIISTPGPVGLAGRLAAHLLNLPMRGIYHTDFPRYLKLWTDDDAVEELTWRYLRWFYGGMDRVYVPSRSYLEQLAAAGFPRDRLGVLPRGIDTKRFHPSRRDPGFWRRWNVGDGLKFLYVGRIAAEKNLCTLLEAWPAVAETFPQPAPSLILVGDGPLLHDLRREFARPDIVFTGALYGDELATAYASADIFVFPSLTDTFGNVLLEAHASGLPAIVANSGGPPEIVSTHGSGLITRGTREDLAAAMRRLRDDAALRQRLREAALAKARDSRWDMALDILVSDLPANEPPARPPAPYGSPPPPAAPCPPAPEPALQSTSA